jgi:hypothetical protein
VTQAIPEELVAAVRDRQAVLFAGAGLSMNVGLPSWREFIEHLCQDLEVSPEDYLGPQVSYHTLAEFYRIRRGSIGALRSWMDRNWKVAEDQVAASKMHDLIVALDFPIIYTTNYDRNIEEAFSVRGKPFVKIANARDIARAGNGVTQIIKFHGDFDDDESLVITETDYFDRLAFDSPLDTKFRADALGRTVLFVGYSMSDLNIRLLLHNLWRTWRRSGYEKDRPKSFVFMTSANPMQEAILQQWGITALTGDSDDPEEALTTFLAELRELVSSRHAGG